MTLQEFELGNDLLATFRFAADAMTSADEGSVVSLEAVPGVSTATITFQGGRALACDPCDAGARSVMQTLEEAGLAKIISVLAVDRDRVVLQGRIFAIAMSFPKESPLEILVTERVADELPAIYRSEPVKFLAENFLLDECAFALANARAAESDFTLLGPKHRLEVRQRNRALYAFRIRPRQKGWVPSAPVRIFRGAIRFKDATLATALNTLHSADLSGTEAAGEYLSCWETYNELEAHYLRLQLNEFGFVRYTSWRRLRKDEKLILSFELADPLPADLRRQSIEVEASANRPGVDPESGNIEIPEDAVMLGEMIADSGNVKRVTVTLNQDAETVRPSQAGYLLPSVRGSEAQLRRREFALKRVLEGDTPLSTLQILLEMGDAPTADLAHKEPRSKRSIAALHDSPTPAQAEALQLALNTPDIALIQGPPGTGKTSVIRALITRWIELQERSRGGSSEEEYRPQILVSSAQHDAVDNAVEGFDIDGLPAYRLGGRRNGDEETRLRSLSDWVKLRRAVCDQKLEGMGASASRLLARSIDRLVAQWGSVHGSDDREVLRQILEIARPHVPAHLTVELSKAIVEEVAANEPETSAMNDDAALERLDRRLQVLIHDQRLTPDSFHEDGAFHAQRLVDFIETHGEALGKSVPDDLRAVVTRPTANRDDVQSVIAMLKEAITALQVQDEAPTIEKLQPNGAVPKLLKQISTALHDRADTGADAVAEALAAYSDELQDLNSVSNMIEKYSGVVAATCQQSVSKDYKTRDYDLVIVDEAARVNPMDLLIPLSHGKRIILVGDHKQLPHMLEPEVKESFIKSGRGKQQFVEQSLFQRLFEKFSDVQAHGGPKRTVTLLDDYRMHPVIGKFVSRTFYPEVDLEPKRTPEERAHRLGLYGNLPVAWIDIPIARGTESGPPSFSKSRSVEVQVVTGEVSKSTSGQSRVHLGSDYLLRATSYEDTVGNRQTACRLQSTHTGRDSRFFSGAGVRRGDPFDGPM